MSRHRPPYPCESGFILSCASSSSEFITVPFLHSTRGFCAPPLRFCSPSRHQITESTIWQISHFLPLFRPQRFSRSRRFTPPLSLQAYFILQPRSRFTLQGLSPAARPIQFVTAFAPRVVRRRSPPAKLPQLSSSCHPNFRDLFPGSDSSRQAGGLDLLTTRSPLEFSTPSGLSPNTLGTPSRPRRS